MENAMEFHVTKAYTAQVPIITPNVNKILWKSRGISMDFSWTLVP